MLKYTFIRFTGSDWIAVNYARTASWEVRVKGNLTRRSDTGRINFSPISNMPPIIRLQHGCNYTITIPGDTQGNIISSLYITSTLQEAHCVCLLLLHLHEKGNGLAQKCDGGWFNYI